MSSLISYCDHYEWIKNAPDLAILVEKIDDLYRAKKKER